MLPTFKISYWSIVIDASIHYFKYVQSFHRVLNVIYYIYWLGQRNSNFFICDFSKFSSNVSQLFNVLIKYLNNYHYGYLNYIILGWNIHQKLNIFFKYAPVHRRDFDSWSKFYRQFDKAVTASNINQAYYLNLKITHKSLQTIPHFLTYLIVLYHSLLHSI